MLSAENIAEIIGVSGSILYLVAYAKLQYRRDFAKTITYNVMNMAAAALILYSTQYFWNLAAVIVNVAWFLLSLYGIRRCYKYKRREAGLEAPYKQS